jgi:tRNA(Ile2) C34 agmatinyltransferase TiaS
VTLMRLCPACGRTLPAVPHTRGKCRDCQREYDRKRGKTRARGYDTGALPFLQRRAAES